MSRTMEIGYRREARKTFMYLSSAEENAGYEERMMQHIRHENFLPFHIDYSEEEKRYYYEISALQPLERVAERGGITGQSLKILILQLDHVLEMLEKYMMSELALLLKPQTIYLDPEQGRFQFCAVPGGNSPFTEQMQTLFLFLLPHLEENSGAVLLCHAMYRASHKENFSSKILYGLLFESVEAAFGENCLGSMENEKDSRNLDSGNLERRNVGNIERRNLESLERRNAGSRRYNGEEKMAAFPAAASETSFENGTNNMQEEKSKIYRISAGRKHALSKSKGKSAERKQGIFPISSGNRQRTGKRSILQLLICLAILCAAPIVVFLLRGSGAVFRMLPFFCVAGIGTILYFVLQWLERNKEYEEEENISEGVEPYHLKNEVSNDTGTSLQGPYRNLTATAAEGGAKESPAVFPEAFSSAFGGEKLKEEDPLFSTWQLWEIEKDAEKHRRLIPLNKELPEILLDHFPFVIGKNKKGSDFVLRDERVSRMHIQFHKEGEQYFMTDLNSANGTKLGEYMLNANETVPIQSGQEISIAGIGYVFA